MQTLDVRVVQATGAAQAFGAVGGGFARAHDADVKRLGAHRFHHRQVVDSRIVGQSHYRRGGMGVLLDVERWQDGLDIDPRHVKGGYFVIARIAHNHIKSQCLGKLGAGSGHRADAGDDQAQRGADPDAHGLFITLHSRTEGRALDKGRFTIVQQHRADQRLLTPHCLSQRLKMRAVFFRRGQSFNQNVEHPTAGKRDLWAGDFIVAIADLGQRLMKITGAQSGQKVFLDTTTGQ